MSYGLRIGPRVTTLRVPEPLRARVASAMEIGLGWPVTDVGGDAVGSVAAVGQRYLAVRTGFLRLSYIPLAAIAAVRDGVVRMNVPARRLTEPDWRTEPRAGL